LAARGYDLVVPWGSESERARSAAICAAVARASAPDRRPLGEVARLIAGARFVVGVDTGLVHLAAALGVPLAAVFAGTEPGLYGRWGRGRSRSLAGKAADPRAG